MRPAKPYNANGNPKLEEIWRVPFLTACSRADETAMSIIDAAIDSSMCSIHVIDRNGRRSLGGGEEIIMTMIATDLALFGESVGAGAVIFDPRDVSFRNGQVLHNGAIVQACWRVECHSIVYAVPWGKDAVSEAFLSVRPAISDAAAEALGVGVAWDFPPENIVY